jgi:mono/diheme cytochrome c family protein
MLVASLAIVVACATRLSAQTLAPSHARTGAELFRDGCVACHGADGRGAPAAQLGFDTPLPDFTECDFATPEPDSDWIAIIHQGGPARAFSRRMPAFQELLADDEIERLVRYLREFCTETAWPRGDLNFPRALFTEKAFPENEALVTTTINRGAEAALGNDFLYEHRLGARSQYEVNVPFDVQKSGGSWGRGLGDVTVAFKHVLFHDIDQGAIVSAGSELLLPTGDEGRGLGKGVTVFEPFLAYGQMLPSDSFVQLHTGIELPTKSTKANREAFVRLALGKTYMRGAWGRSWTPTVEVLAARELASGEPTLWDVVPQMQVTLSRRQHIMISGGVRLPVNERGERRAQVVAYFLWDWFDGGLFEGWR